MVKVSKIAVWDVDGELIRDSAGATAKTRHAIIIEMLKDWNPNAEFQKMGISEISDWMTERWDAIEVRVKKAMTGT
jgi:hypothetical protein